MENGRTLKELQRESVESVYKFVKATGRKEPDVPTIMVHLTEELGELAAQVFNEMSGRGKTDLQNAGEEIADIFMEICMLADKYGIDLEEAVVNKMKKNMKGL